MGKVLYVAGWALVDWFGIALFLVTSGKVQTMWAGCLMILLPLLIWEYLTFVYLRHGYSTIVFNHKRRELEIPQPTDRQERPQKTWLPDGSYTYEEDD